MIYGRCNFHFYKISWRIFGLKQLECLTRNLGGILQDLEKSLFRYIFYATLVLFW